MKKIIYKLLSQFMFGKISPDDFYKLRTEIKTCSEDDLKAIVEQLWAENDIPSTLSLSTKLQVLDSIECHAPISSYIYKILKIASIIIFPLLLTWGPYLYFTEQKKQLPDMSIMTDRGQKTHLLLPDSSKVWLNAESTLTYPSDFGDKNRTVRLTGEGYFEVVKNKNLEFRVETKDINVIVHGTKFNVNAFETNPETYISLIEGCVSIENKELVELATLQPHHSIKINNQSASFEIIKEDTEITSLWSLNKCKIENVSTEELFRKTGYWYGMKIHLADNYKQHSYSLTIKNESFREFLSLVNELTPIVYEIKGEEVTIQYK